MRLRSFGEASEFFHRMLKEFVDEVKPYELYKGIITSISFGMSDGGSTYGREEFDVKDFCFTISTKESIPSDIPTPSEFRGYQILYNIRKDHPVFFSTNCGPDD